MAYTTVTNCSTDVPYNFEGQAKKKLTQDGWIDLADNFNRTGFIQFFIDRTSSFIEAYLSSVTTPPFSQSGLLEKINRSLTIYEIEMYIKSSQQDRTISVTIYSDRKDALNMLNAILDGDMFIDPLDEASNQGTVRLAESDQDGITLTVGGLEGDIFFGDPDATEVPE